jgi:hypothetical protein
MEKACCEEDYRDKNSDYLYHISSLIQPKISPNTTPLPSIQASPKTGFVQIIHTWVIL